MHASKFAALAVFVILLASRLARSAEEPVSVVRMIRESENRLAATDHAAARDLARRAVELDPAHAPAWLQLGAVELRDQNYPEAVKAFRESLTVDPAQTSIWKVLSLAEWSAGRSDEAIASIRQYLAHAPTDATALHDLAVWLAATGETGEALEILNRLVKVEGADSRLWKELGSIYFRQGNYASARDAYEESLKHEPDDPAVHRDLAWCYWNMHQKEGARPLLEKALASIQVYLKSDPGNVPLNIMAGRILSALDMRDQARDHYSALLARNTNFVPALVYLREDATTRGHAADAVAYAERRARIEPSNLDARLDLANSLAQFDRFQDALRILRALSGTSVHAARLVLAYQTLGEFDGPGRNTIDQVLDHLTALAQAGYTCGHQIGGDAVTHAAQAIIIIQGASESDLRAIDEKLAASGGKAVYAGPLADAQARRTLKPSARIMKSLEASGRWLVMPSANLDRISVTASGTLGNPLTHFTHTGDRVETAGEKSDRVASMLGKLLDQEFENPERLLIYPFGDYGQRSLDCTGIELTDLQNEAGRIFAHGIYFADQAYHLADAEPMLVPALEVSPLMSKDAFARMLNAGNPLVAARLELAKVLYWHRQYEQAHYWFAQAEASGADAFNLYFSWAACSDNQGDIPTARTKLAKARAIDPDDERLADLARRIEDRTNARVGAQVRTWQDNEDRSFTQSGAEGSVFAGDSLQLGLLANRNHWEQDGKGSEEGIRAGLTAKAFVVPQVWLDASLWHLDMDDTEDLTGGDAMIHLPFRWTSGFVELSAAREEIETVEALRAGLHVDTYRFHTYSRVLDRYDLFAHVIEQVRSDDNNTAGFEGRLLYRAREWPYVGIGYHLRIADSDRDPPEYWAPEQLEQHQAHLNLRRTYGSSRLSFSGDAGYAHEQNTDWRFVWGVNGNLETLIYRSLSLRLQAQYYESPTYNRTAGTLGIGLEF